MSCAKIISKNLHKDHDSECLYQGEFLQLDTELQYVQHARMFVMRDRICLASLEHEDGDCSINNCVEIPRSCVNIDFVKDSPYTFKMNVKNPQNDSNVYQLCDRQESWPEFLKSFDLHDHVEERNEKQRVLPKVTFDEMDDYISDSESECSSLSEGSSADDIGLPRCFTLCVGQGLGGMSTYNVNNAMMMMNPSHVRRLNKDNSTRRGSVDFLGLPSTDLDEILRHSNSYPQLNYNTKTERSRSLPNLTELDNVLLDEDLRHGSLNRRKRNGFAHNTHRHRGSDADKAANFLSSVEYRTEYGKRHANNYRELRLNEEISKLIAQPSSIKFCNTAGRSQDKNENKLDPICESLAHEHFAEPKATSEQPKSRAYEVIDTTGGGKFKLSFKRFWKRREKFNVNKSVVKSDASAQQESDPEHVVFINKLAVDYKCNIQSMPSYAVSSDRRGGFGSDVSGKKEHVNISTVTKQKDCTSSTGVQPKEKTKLTPNSQPTLSGKDTIRKKIVKRILSPITILRSVSEEEKTINDLPQIVSPGFEGKSNDVNGVLVEPRPIKKLLDMNPLHIAQELTLIDKELLVRISWNELSSCNWMTKHKHQRSPSVMAMVEFFNRIAMLVASEILFEVDPMMRVRVISKVIQVATKLRAMGNFNSLKAFLGGLQCTPIYRLKETWKEVSSKRKKNFRDLTRFMSEENNFAAYRNEVASLMSQNAPCLPFVGDFLTQIAQTQTYMACRKTKSPEPPKDDCFATTETDVSPTTPRTQPIDKHDSKGKTPSRTSLVKRRSASVKAKNSLYSKSSPNLPASCTRTPERPYRSNRFRRCRSWQHSNDSGIQVNSNNSSLSASSASFLNSNTSLGSGTFGFHSKNGTSEDARTGNARPHNLGRSSSTSTPISAKSSRKFKLRRNQSVSEKCLSNSESGTSLKTRLSFMRSFRRSKSMDQSPSSAESLQKLYLAKMENAGSPGKTPDVKEVRRIPEPETTDETGTELELWHFHVAAIQYNFPSRPQIKDFLLTTEFNSEEDNYRLSLQREPLHNRSQSAS